MAENAKTASPPAQGRQPKVGAKGVKEPADIGKIQEDERTPLQPASAPPSLLRSPLAWCRTLARTYSCKLLLMVVCTNHLLKGFVAGGGDSGLLGSPMEFLFKEHKVGAGRMQMYMAVAVSPWALKPVLGFLSDSCPILGYHKMPYIFATSAAGLAGCLVIGVYGSELTVPTLVLCLFAVFLSASTMDLLVKATQSTEVKKSAALGPDFFLFTWLGCVLGMIAATMIAGALIEHVAPQACYLVALPFMALALWPTIMNYLGEQPLPEEERAGRMIANFAQHPEMCSLALGMGVVLATLGVLTANSGHNPEGRHAMLSVAASLLLVGAFALFIRWEMSGPVIFWFLLQACPKIDGALFYFYTDGPEMFPIGPWFSASLYTTGLGLACFFGALAGYLTGSELFRNWRYPSIILLTVPLRAIVRLLLLPMLWRWTTAPYYVSDRWLALTVEFFSSMIYSYTWIPRQVMSAHMTPDATEATMLALMSGSFNMGGMISSYLGSWLLDAFSIGVDGTAKDGPAFEHIWKPYAVSVVCPLLVLALLPGFIPNRLQTEALITERPESTTHGSPFSRYLQRRRRGAEGAPV